MYAQSQSRTSTLDLRSRYLFLCIDSRRNEKGCYCTPTNCCFACSISPFATRLPTVLVYSIDPLNVSTKMLSLRNEDDKISYIYAPLLFLLAASQIRMNMNRSCFGIDTSISLIFPIPVVYTRICCYMCVFPSFLNT